MKKAYRKVRVFLGGEIAIGILNIQRSVEVKDLSRVVEHNTIESYCVFDVICSSHVSCPVRRRQGSKERGK